MSNNNRPSTMSNIGSPAIKLSNPLSHHFIPHYIFLINLYKLTMNFHWLNIYAEKFDYPTSFFVDGIGSRLKHFENLLTSVKTTKSGYNSHWTDNQSDISAHALNTKTINAVAVERSDD
ncbi:hypothetical protein TNCV_377331 [Trichonephila clavipes]|nr:hypothetical protein TNCV_377331 [Trichonephila clavipes]